MSDVSGIFRDGSQVSLLPVCPRIRDFGHAVGKGFVVSESCELPSFQEVLEMPNAQIQ